MSEKFKIRVGEFDGPLDLLLQLIEKNKLHISEICLAQVADDFIAHIQGNQIAKRDMADFLIIASTLMFIKSVSLLPTIKKTEEETSSIEELERRLLLYQRYKDLGDKIKNIYGKKPFFYREESKQLNPIFAPTKEVTNFEILSAIKSVIASLPKPQKIPEHIVKKVISLETVIENLTTRIQSSFKLRFSEFLGEHKHERVNVIVSFLGMLELVRQGIVDVSQSAPFQDIDIENQDIQVPKY